MNTEKVLKYAHRYYDAEFIRVDNDGDYALQRDGDTLYLFLEWSHGKTDWKNNFDFPAKPYKDMGATWFCHRGFLKVWKSIEPHVKDAIMDETIIKIVVVGYSHGAAIATLAHEYVWFHRPDIRDAIEGYGFGAPRCYWGFNVKKSLKKRWENFHPVRNDNDIVAHVPPVLFGFTHVNKIVQVHGGSKKVTYKNKIKSAFCNFLLKISGAGAHYWSSYIRGIENLTQQND